MVDERRVAVVTGASRGLGKAIAVWLARAGYDVAIRARTVDEGVAREHSSTVAASDSSPLPGSLSATTALVQAEGARAPSDGVAARERVDAAARAGRADR